MLRIGRRGHGADAPLDEPPRCDLRRRPPIFLGDPPDLGVVVVVRYLSEQAPSFVELVADGCLVEEPEDREGQLSCSGPG